MYITGFHIIITQSNCIGNGVSKMWRECIALLQVPQTASFIFSSSAGSSSESELESLDCGITPSQDCKYTTFKTDF